MERLSDERMPAEFPEIREIVSESAPMPVGPYSSGVVYQGLLFASGQIPLDPSTNRLVEGEIEIQTGRAIDNLAAVLDAGGSSLERVLRTTVYVTDLSLFPRINAVYAKRFCGDPPPARATVEVAALPLGAAVEIDAIAAVEA